MSKKRVSRATHAVRTTPTRVEFRRFLGISLGGNQSDRTAVAVLDYYPGHNKVFVSQLHGRISANEHFSADERLFELISAMGQRLEMVAVDAPLKLPKCLRCRLKCPGVAACTQPEVEWLKGKYSQLNRDRRPKRFPFPHSQRCAEVHIERDLEEVFHPHPGMSANRAPLMARALFLARQMPSVPWIEVYPKLSLWRLGRKLGVAKVHLRYHKHSVDGDEARRLILKALVDSEIAFLYEQDQRLLVDNAQTFDALLSALTAVFKHRQLTEPKPRDFPRSEGWIEYPLKQFKW